MAEKAEVKVVIVPGNGAGDVTRCNWYGWLQDKLTKAGEYNPYRLIWRTTMSAWWIFFLVRGGLILLLCIMITLICMFVMDVFLWVHMWACVYVCVCVCFGRCMLVQ